MEEKVVKINRNCGAFVFPADCLVVAAMNPCRCGYFPDRNKCNCMINEVKKYRSKINGPILDRIDLNMEVSRTDINDIMNSQETTSSDDMINLVNKAIEFQKRRQNGIFNSKLSSDEIKRYCFLNKDASDFMKSAYEKFDLSMRGYFKIIKVARTIADMEENDNINANHLMEALAYRVNDRFT